MPLASPPSAYTFLPIIDSVHHNMDFSGHGKSPRRELQGPRPTPLKVRKDSHKIRKPPPVPQQQHQQPPPVHRPPVIIYTVSPKIIHANPNEFMQLVQRLTGPNSSTTSSSSPVHSSSHSFFPDSGAISPAARYASIEKIKSPEGKRNLQQNGHVQQMVDGSDLTADIDRITGLFPGILSPGPSSLPPIPPNFFSPLMSSDPNPLSFFHDLSPGLQTSRNFNIDGSFMPSNFIPSPSNNLFSPNINYSTSPSVDLFNNFFDF
ncbi:nuclear speckle RNA-binding protein B [Daucus carota subsp. sativus]|nr:PREDICTED: nuclear speckle RNA-binding protein B-like [Daucus carota subsp. sativus]